MNVFVVADTHFNRAGLVEYQGRHDMADTLCQGSSQRREGRAYEPFFRQDRRPFSILPSRAA